jgi:hypothetical protein
MESPKCNSASGTVTQNSDVHSQKLYKLAKKAASTCVGGVLPSNALMDAVDLLRKPYNKPHVSSGLLHNAEKGVFLGAETTQTECLPASKENEAIKKHHEHDNSISSISHLLDVGKFDMLEKPKVEKKWGKVSMAVKEKSVAVAAAARTKEKIETVHPTDLVLFYYAKHRNTIW